MGGFLSALAGALNAGAQTGARVMGSERATEAQNLPGIVQLAMQRQALERQMQQLAMQQRLDDARIHHYGAQDEALQRPKPPSYDFITGPDGNVTGVDKTNPTHVMPVPGVKAHLPPAPAQFTFPTGTDANGNPIVLRGNTHSGQLDRTDIGRPATGQAEGRTQAQLSVAVNQAQQADKVMRAFEDQLLAGKRTISSHAAAAAKLSMTGGALTSTGAETALNEMDPDLATYVRAAKAMSTAERLITPRGGSNYLTQAEAILSAAGPHANAAQIEQARAYRQALVGGLQNHGTQATPTHNQGGVDGSQPDAGGNVFGHLIPRRP